MFKRSKLDKLKMYQRRYKICLIQYFKADSKNVLWFILLSLPADFLNYLFQKVFQKHYQECETVMSQGTKIYQNCTCPSGRVTYNFHSSCKHMHLSFKSVYNKEHKGVICNMIYKVPYITLKMIFTRQIHNCIPYTDKKISESILKKC